ncbi:hypothetical protein GO013_11650 [Pseudodesulfovibrio sp. JC047]|uniref:hypothetical protein n=1 Tax=Pseudodesulfovibrio sp. JC047 TaxID=2683199 RepID=UPI0013D1B502|nr:hypothetical protein [Pseudodesulfovibrio sp. JC047]NDV20069.1 hypothetical protein [Pseudodesulfovibrio sp. JC047]
MIEEGRKEGRERLNLSLFIERCALRGGESFDIISKVSPLRRLAFCLGQIVKPNLTPRQVPAPQ